MPKTAMTLLTEKAYADPSFAISVGVQTGISMLPLLFFGTPEQKQKYLPQLASGEKIGAYCLSEANSGSDALAAQAKATLAPDGKRYLLNGTKMWITNGGFADLYTVFAKIDGEQFTAFLVERDTPGLSLGKEEHKLGLRGSSTRRVILENAPVPVENVLGEIGKGHQPALYSLNIGRFNIGAGALGASKEALRIATQYARQRVQFKQPIAHFGMIQYKLAEMALRIFVLESMIYRIAGYWDRIFGQIDASAPDAGTKYRAASEEYAVECAIIKFFGTEALDYVVDEGLQIHGGYGYSEEFPMARAYRDARINRIFEGTNEINRLTVMDQLLRRAQRGRLPLSEAIAAQHSSVTNPAAKGSRDLEEIEIGGRQLRRAILYTIGQAWEAFGEKLPEQQEVSAALADMAAALFGLESAYLRLRKLEASSASESYAAMLAAARVYGSDAYDQVDRSARYVLAALGTGDALSSRLDTLSGLLSPPAVDTVALRRQIAALVIERDGYPWG